MGRLLLEAALFYEAVMGIGLACSIGRAIGAIACIASLSGAWADPRKPIEVEFSAEVVTTSFLGTLDRASIYVSADRTRLDVPQSGGSIFFDASTQTLLVVNSSHRRIEEMDVRKMQDFDAVRCRSNIGLNAIRIFTLASLYRFATVYRMPMFSVSAEVVRQSVDQLFDVSATRYAVAGPLLLTNVMPTYAAHFAGEAWMAPGNIVVRLSGRLSIRGSNTKERQIEFFHELTKLKVGPVDRNLLEPPTDFERVKSEIDLSLCE